MVFAETQRPGLKPSSQAIDAAPFTHQDRALLTRLIQQKTMRAFLSTIFWLCSCATLACAQETTVRPQTQTSMPAATQTTQPGLRLPPDPNKYAVVISGVSGEEQYAKKFAEWTNKLRAALIDKLGFAEDHTFILTEKPTEKELRATAEVLQQTFVRLRNTLKPEQQLFVFFIGHGTFDPASKTAKFNLVGPDLSAGEYAQLINTLPARNIVVVNMSSASGEFIKPLSGSLAGGTRIVITATRSGMEQNATRFAEYFINALGNPEADADKSGRVSVLEAFEYATKQVAKSFEGKGNLATEHALIDDNGDGTGHQIAEAGDGGMARVTYFDSLPQQQAGGDPVLAKLFEEQMRLEGEIERIKARKAQMAEDAYYDELEKPLLELARVGQNIRAKKK